MRGSICIDGKEYADKDGTAHDNVGGGARGESNWII